MEKSNKLKVIIFWSAILAITILFVSLIIVRVCQVRTFDEISDIKKAKLLLNGTNITEKEDELYYVFIYTSGEQNDVMKNEEIQPIVLGYFTYVNQKQKSEGITKIYGYDIAGFTKTLEYQNVGEYLTSLHTNIKITDCPILIKVTNGSVSNVYSTITAIEEAINGEMKSNK